MGQGLGKHKRPFDKEEMDLYIHYIQSKHQLTSSMKERPKKKKQTIISLCIYYVISLFFHYMYELVKCALPPFNCILLSFAGYLMMMWVIYLFFELHIRIYTYLHLHAYNNTLAPSLNLIMVIQVQETVEECQRLCLINRGLDPQNSMRSHHLKAEHNVLLLLLLPSFPHP